LKDKTYYIKIRKPVKIPDNAILTQDGKSMTVKNAKKLTKIHEKKVAKHFEVSVTDK